jgi:hypothetical protein
VRLSFAVSRAGAFKQGINFDGAVHPAPVRAEIATIGLFEFSESPPRPIHRKQRCWFDRDQLPANGLKLRGHLCHLRRDHIFGTSRAKASSEPLRPPGSVIVSQVPFGTNFQELP